MQNSSYSMLFCLPTHSHLSREASHFEREIQQALKEKKFSQVSSLRTKYVFDTQSGKGDVCSLYPCVQSSTFLTHPFRLRTVYEQLVLSHYQVSVKKDIEQCMWKSCFYKAIEDYRARTRQVRTVHLLLAKSSGCSIPC